jgi:hypothetical protein
VRRLFLGHLATPLVLILLGCDSWSGSDSGGAGTPGAHTTTESGSDGGPGMRADASMGVPMRPDGGAHAGQPETAALGDERAGYVLCGPASCGGDQLCCTTNTDGPLSACALECGITEATIACDGPEDCGKGEVCCHRFGAPGLVTECITLPGTEPEASAGADAGVDAGADAGADAGSDAHAPLKACEGNPEDPAEQRVACHVDHDCATVPNRPLCRMDAKRRDYLGYCVADTDVPGTKGHDDKNVVSCGDPDGDGIGRTCSLSDGLCCLSKYDSSMAGCTTHKDCSFSELSVRCDGPEDCQGKDMCCYLPKHQSDAGLSEAESACLPDCAAADPAASRRCHTDEDCAPGGKCEGDASSPWWGVCRG